MGVLVIPSAKAPSPGAVPESSSASSGRTLTLLSAFLKRLGTGSRKLTLETSLGTVRLGRGGAALHPWRQSLKEFSFGKHRIINSSTREGNVLKELQTQKAKHGGSADVSFPSRGRDGTSRCPQTHQEMLSVLFHTLHQLYQQLCPRLFCTAGVKPKSLNNLPGICSPVPLTFPFPGCGGYI